ncbi:CLIP domain-containing serine protease HP8-like [Anopheles ziemanni]|uniref:CLIP domain-containing serine protease HP8-like n=1 Tax=Anopheles ziemanni TaxID=345580 RepID=UPI00265E5263|nr:CLIP domain-containing serine protease HP8-like [Anopheles ziemanni]
MHSVNLVTWLLLIIAYWIVLATSNKCPIGYECVDIRKCDRFAPYLYKLNSWSKSLRRELKTLHCSNKIEVLMKVYKVCCASVKKRQEELLDPQICGLVLSTRDAYETETKLYQHPWIALLHDHKIWLCLGTLINERYILTAAHCVKNEKNFVRLGEFDLSQRIDCDQLAKSSIKFSCFLYQQDVKPICLPVTPELKENEPWYKVTSWDQTENGMMSGKLQSAEVNLLPQDACNTWIAQVDKYIRNTNTQVCALGAANMSEHCRGDSGGPLLTRTGTGYYVQYGVISYGLFSCGKDPFPGIYTRVASFIDWILENLEE